MLETVVVIMQRKSSLNVTQEALGSNKGSNSFQSMEWRKVYHGGYNHDRIIGRAILRLSRLGMSAESQDSTNRQNWD